jgi:hypothetical protein
MRAGSVQQHTSREHLQHGCCRSLSSSKARSSRRITPDCVSWPVPASCHRRADAVLVPPTKAVSEQTTTAPPQPLATKDEDTIAAIVTGTLRFAAMLLHAESNRLSSAGYWLQEALHRVLLQSSVCLEQMLSRCGSTSCVWKALQ